MVFYVESTRNDSFAWAGCGAPCWRKVRAIIRLHEREGFNVHKITVRRKRRW